MFYIGCVAVACQNKSDLYLITAGFLHKHSYECKHFAVVSVNRHQLQGEPLTRGFAPEPHWGHSLLTPTVAPNSLSKIFLALFMK